MGVAPLFVDFAEVPPATTSASTARAPTRAPTAIHRRIVLRELDTVLLSRRPADRPLSSLRPRLRRPPRAETHPAPGRWSDHIAPEADSRASEHDPFDPAP